MINLNGYTILNIILSAYTTVITIAASILEFIISNKSKDKEYMFFYSGLVLIIITGLRNRGWDYNLYKSIYYNTPDLFSINIFNSNWQEPGFRLIFSLFKTLGVDYQICIYFIGLITLLLIYNSIIRYSRYPLLSLSIFYCLYFYRGSYGQIRQALAMGIAIYSLKYILNSKLVKFIIFNIIAVSIHSVAIVFIPAYFFVKQNFSRRTLISFLLISIAISFKSKEIYEFLIGFDYEFLYKVKFYYSNNLYIERKFITFEMLRGIFLALIYIKYREKLTDVSKANSDIISLYILGSVIYNILSFDLRIASRTARMYEIFEILLLPQLIAIENKKFNKLIIFILILLLCIYTLIKEFIMMKSGTINYYY